MDFYPFLNLFFKIFQTITGINVMNLVFRFNRYFTSSINPAKISLGFEINNHNAHIANMVPSAVNTNNITS